MVGNITGNVKGINWKGGAQGGLAGAVGGIASGLGDGATASRTVTSELGQIALRSSVQVAGNYLVGKALYNQSFSWKALAAGVAGSMADSYAGDMAMPGLDTGAGQFMKNAFSSFAGGYTENRTRVWMHTGGVRSNEQLLTDAFGNALGNSVAGVHAKAAAHERMRQGMQTGVSSMASGTTSLPCRIASYGWEANKSSLPDRIASYGWEANKSSLPDRIASYGWEANKSSLPDRIASYGWEANKSSLPDRIASYGWEANKSSLPDRIASSGWEANKSSLPDRIASYRWRQNPPRQTGPIWFRPMDHEYVVGRLGDAFVWDGRQGFGIGSFIDDFIPGGHTFGANHDNFVSYAVDQMHYPDILVNIPSMLVMYPLAIIQEIINTPMGIFNWAFDTNYEVPLLHSSPYKEVK